MYYNYIISRQFGFGKNDSMMQSTMGVVNASITRTNPISIITLSRHWTFKSLSQDAPPILQNGCRIFSSCCLCYVLRQLNQTWRKAASTFLIIHELKHAHVSLCHCDWQQRSSNDIPPTPKARPVLLSRTPNHCCAIARIRTYDSRR